ncbi:two-component system sensor histidine kinase CreC [Marinobacterium lutimaris]|uniref:histidine kinase n=1 Tax=Marinobacterium lutimaris TaxID=568106 RepID=A0A1H6AUT7_9GAMM|nr:two-component system sensor histidine kinase CreC [Marinobacterium lutimaris]SEG52064.1 two-component system, OmpR family, sensor histidine kinase CreC [Marinobacterium lutimaris]
MKIRTRLLLAFTLFVFLGVFGLVYWIADEIRPQFLKAQEETLVDSAELMAALVSEQAVHVEDEIVQIDPTPLAELFGNLRQRTLNARIYNLDKNNVDLRIYLTNRDGRVIFDSDNSRDLGADYSRWRDVNLTLQGRYGARATGGDPLYPEGSTLYIARPVLYEGDVIGVLSLGKPTTNASRFVIDLRNNLILSAFVIALAVTLVGVLLNLWFTRPLQKLQQYAAAISRGERREPPRLGNNEVGDVGSALESMRVALDGKSYVADYVQSLTHEIKSPLAGIRGAAELLQEPMPEAQRERFLNNIVGQTERIQQLIERLLELAALENRPSLEAPEKVSLAAIIEQALSAEQDQARARGVGLRVESSDSGSVQGDPFLIRQALSNLIKNAIEYSPTGAEVVIGLEAQEDCCALRVSDSGPGIPDYARERVLERFYSLPKPNGDKGTGLGLSFVKEIMALHDGEIEIESDESGTRVCLIFSANG